MSSGCLLYLSCSDKDEAGKIANTLLVKQLIVCAKSLPVSSMYRWQGRIEESNEVLLIMESRIDLFDEVESEVAKLHSYDTFVLEAVAVNKISVTAQRWAEDELADEN